MLSCFRRWVPVVCLLFAACAQDGAGGGPCVSQASQALVVCAKGQGVLQGIDVSKWQGQVDWARVSKAGVHFAFARVSDGARTVDGTFVANFQGMRRAGIVRGAYQFFRPQQDPVAQAELLLASLDQAGGLAEDDLPPVLDLEADDGVPVEAYRRRAQAWLDHVEAALGRRPIVYTGARFESFTGEAFADYPLWAPHYKPDYEGRCPNIADGWARWHFWQWTNEGRVAGVQGPVDRNIFDGTAADLAQLIETSFVPVGPGDSLDGGVAFDDGGVDEVAPLGDGGAGGIFQDAGQLASSALEGPGLGNAASEGAMGRAGLPGSASAAIRCR